VCPEANKCHIFIILDDQRIRDSDRLQNLDTTQKGVTKEILIHKGKFTNDRRKQGFPCLDLPDYDL
jgi:hypothetical protein